MLQLNLKENKIQNFNYLVDFKKPKMVRFHDDNLLQKRKNLVDCINSSLGGFKNSDDSIDY